MRKITAIVITTLLAGCAGDAQFIRQTPIISNDGEKTYILKNDMAGSEWSKRHTLKGLDERSKQLCPTGYTLINEEIIHVGNLPTIHNMSTHMATWQIKCNKQLESSS